MKYPTVDLDYKADLEIDQYNLEGEWLGQARKMMDYSEALAQSLFDRNRAKENLEVVKSGLDSSIRFRASSGNEKVTEAVVSSRINTDPNYLEALHKFQEAEYVVSILQGAVAAFQARKTALENLVQLFKLRYYSEPYEGSSEIREKGMERGRLEQNKILRNEIKGKLPVRKSL